MKLKYVFTLKKIEKWWYRKIRTWNFKFQEEFGKL